MSKPPLIAHIIHRLDFGGLENGLVNLINRIPSDRFHHAIICMTDYSDFAKRITNPNVTLHALHKAEGKDAGIYIRLWRLLRQLQPSIVHTRNLSALEGSVVAALAGVPARIHSEHGRDLYDIQTNKLGYLLLRRFCRGFIDRYIPLSKELETWLLESIRVPKKKVCRIYNGVDISRFSTSESGRKKIPLESFDTGSEVVVGTVGRLQSIKDQVTLVKAYSKLLKESDRTNVRLVIVGDGPMMKELNHLVTNEGLEKSVWLAGARNDIPDLLKAFDIMVLPSKSEGISNTILEAMATGLPVIATAVGGNPELVIDGETGVLVPAQNPESMSDAIEYYLQNRGLMRAHGMAGRKRAEQEFSMENMVSRYMAVYEEVMR